MNCTPGISSLRGAVHVCTCEFDILALSFVCNTSVIRQPSTSGLVEITRNSVSPLSQLSGRTAHVHKPSLFISRPLAHMLHASLPPSVVLCYAHVHALQSRFLRATCPTNLVTDAFRFLQAKAWERICALSTVADSEGSPRCLLVQIALDPTFQFTAETCGPKVSLHCPP